MFLYLLLQNRWSWALLSEGEKDIIHEANKSHNNFRNDYANPELYEAGKSWDSHDDRMGSYRGWGSSIKSFLDEFQPSSILEIGPGSGYFSKMICESEFVHSYYGIDINKAFLDYLKPRIQEIKKNKPGFSFKLFHGDFFRTNLPQVDAIIILSAVHHIPNRVDLFKVLSTFLKENGKVLCIEPTHYFPRVFRLMKKILSTYYKRSYWQVRNNLSTHHHCTISEFRNIASKVNLRISKVWFYDFSWVCRLYRIFYPLLLKGSKKWDKVSLGFPVVDDQDTYLRYFSNEIGIIISKDSTQ